MSVNVTVDLIKHLDSTNQIQRNLINPVIKDTLPLPHGGYAILRFLAENAGIWLFHCHVELHSELGMSLVVKVGKPSEFPPLPINWPKCSSNYEPIDALTDTPLSFNTSKIPYHIELFYFLI